MRPFCLRIVPDHPHAHQSAEQPQAARHKEAEADIFKKGSVIIQTNGITKGNPSVDIAVKFEASATRLATKLGITKNNTTVAKGNPGYSKKPKSKREGLLYKR